jgi:hypothetical protein
MMADGPSMGPGSWPSAEALAADPAFAGTYAPVVTSFRLHPSRFAAGVGAPSLTTLNGRMAVWAFDAALDERIVGTFEVPAGWATLTVDYEIANVTADSGDVRWGVDFGEFADGDNLNASLPIAQASVVTALGQYVLDVATISTSAMACTPGKQQVLRVGRTGASGTDTKAGDAGIIGVIINKAS